MMKKLVKILVVLALIFGVGQSMVAYAMEKIGPGVETEENTQIKTTMPEQVVMFGKVYNAFDSINGVQLYSREDDIPEQHVIDAIGESGITNEMDSYFKVLNMSAYICEKLTYNYEVARRTNEDKHYWESDPMPFTSECILKGEAVCAGYTELLQDMCKAVGIESYYLTGYTQIGDSEPAYHAWNSVTINGETYYADVCWFDSAASIRWFDSEPLEGHTIDAWHEQYRINSKTSGTAN